MEFFDDVDSNYRYWKLEIIDRTNPLGATGLKIGYIYLGDYVTLTYRNTSRGFTKEIVDNTEMFETESGNLWFDEKFKYYRFNSIGLPLLTRTEKESFEAAFYSLGINNPFFISFDPDKCISTNQNDLTKYVILDSMPIFTHVIGEYFNCNFSVREMN